MHRCTHSAAGGTIQRLKSWFGDRVIAIEKAHGAVLSGFYCRNPGSADRERTQLRPEFVVWTVTSAIEGINERVPIAR